jgi:hypothetical protein
MRPKKSKEPKKYAVGGFVAAGALGALQSALGASQMFAGQAAASRIKEASTARPSEYAELLKQARNADLETRRIEELNRAIGTGIAAAQGAGGRAVIGSLPGMVRAADVGAIDILGQRRSDTMQALQFGAQGAEREIGREINREMMERGAAQAAIEGGLQNFAGGLGQVGSAAIYSELGKTVKDVEKEISPNPEDAIRQQTMKSLGKTQRERDKIGESLVDLQGQLDEDRVPLLAANRSKVANILAPEEDEFNLGSRLFQLPSQLKEGGMVTGGKFDHKTNPIDIVQKGRKVGEMTGGEVILNPAQQKKLSKESAYFRTLLKKFNKQK